MEIMDSEKKISWYEKLVSTANDEFIVWEYCSLQLHIMDSSFIKRVELRKKSMIVRNKISEILSQQQHLSLISSIWSREINFQVIHSWKSIMDIINKNVV